MHLSEHAKKIFFGFLVVALLTPGAYVAIQRIDAPPAEAFPTEQLISLPDWAHWLIEFVGITIEHIGYKMLKGTLAKLGHNLAVSTFRDFSQAGPGQEPLFEVRSFEDQILDEVKNGGGLFLEGLAAGVETATTDVRLRPEKKGEAEKKITEETAVIGAIEGEKKNLQDTITGHEEEVRQFNEDLKSAVQEKETAQREHAGAVQQRGDAGRRLFLAGAEEKSQIESEISQLDERIKELDETSSAVQEEIEFNRDNGRELQERLQREKGDLFSKDADIMSRRQQIGEHQAEIKFIDANASWKAQYGSLSKTGNTAQAGVSDGAKAIIQSLCSPDVSAKIRLTFGFAEPPKEQKPLCTITQLTQNWEKAIKKTGIEDMFKPGYNGWKLLSDAISPSGKEPTVALDLYSSLFQEKTEAAQRAAQKYGIDTTVGAKPITTIAGAILTPGSAVKKQLDEAIKQTADGTVAPVLTGKLMADLVDLVVTFADSFAGKSWDLIMKGIVSRATAQNIQQKNTGGGGGRSSGPLYDEDAAPTYSQQKASAVKTAQLAKLEYKPGLEDIKVLAELQGDTNCLDNPNFCVLSDGFAQAITQKMTLGEALCYDQPADCSPVMNKNGIFGFQNSKKLAEAFRVDGPDFKTNYPYHIMPILRKYRVIPVGWEIAALYIKQVPDVCRPGDFEYDCTISDVVGKYTDSASPFYRLVDPNWVLKLPAAKCAITGYGPAAITGADGEAEENKVCRDTNGDGQIACSVGEMNENLLKLARTVCFDPDKPATENITDEDVKNCVTNGKPATDPDAKFLLDSKDLLVTRPKVCLDERTCLLENPDGSCKEFGYCLEERNKLVFRGKECRKEYDSCQGFTNAETNQTTYILKRSIPGLDATQTTQGDGENKCDRNLSGCSWYSKKRNSGDTARTTAAWSRAEQDRVYLTSVASVCNAEFAGCTALTNLADNSPAAFRVPPPEFRCNETINGKPGYKRDECRDYALQCAEGYIGCKLYSPANGDPLVAGTGPALCDSNCVNLTNYREMPSDIEQRFGVSEASTATAIFVPSSAASCPSAEAGCEEFTDLDAERQGSGETLQHYSKIKACEVAPSSPDPRNEFYSWFGSDQSGGSRLVKFQYAHDTPDQPVPKCAPGAVGAAAVCDCASTVTGTNDPVKGTCREFINVNGSTSKRWTDLLVYPVAAGDCHSYRRTIGGSIYSLSRNLSKSCQAKNVDCHEYRAPSAGNVQVVFYDDFESKSNRSWYVIPTTTTTPALATPSSDTETLYETSIRAESASVLYRALGSSALLKTSKYLLEFMAKADEAATVSNVRIGTVDATTGAITTNAVGSSRDGAASSVTLPAGEWTNVRMYFDGSSFTTDRVSGATLMVSLAPSTGSAGVNVTADRFLFKRMEGLEYQRKGAWTVSGDQCKNEGTFAPYAPQYGTYQYECRQYKPEAGGSSVAYQGFSRLCPIEMVGCGEFADSSRKKIVLADRYSFPSWTAADSASTVTSTADVLEASGTTSATTGSVSVVRPVTLKKNTPYKFTLRFKETTSPYAREATGEKGFKAVSVQILTALTGGTTSSLTPAAPIQTSPALMEYNKIDRQYAIWEDFSFSTTGIAFSSDTASAYIKILASGAKGAHSFALDDIILTEDLVQNSLYLVADPKKSCPTTEAGCTAYGMPNLDAAGRIKTQVKRVGQGSATSTVEQWSEKTFKITPAEIAFTLPGTNGVCREQHLRCQEYSYQDKYGEEQATKQAYFRDPGGYVCASNDAGGEVKWTKSVCEAGSPSKDIPCTRNSECGLKSDGKEYACNKDVSCGSAPTSTLPTLDADPNKIQWVYGCKKEEDTCRKITDPECGQFTVSQIACTVANKGEKCSDASRFTGACLKADFAAVTGAESGTCQLSATVLRTQYGQGNTGISCRSDYYYRSDVSTRGCEGKVDVEKGCLLFHDSAIGNATTDKFVSSNYYAKYWREDRKAQSVSEADAGTAAKDSNIVLKARYDRECKTSLACTDYFSGGGANQNVVCYKRRPCETSQDSACAKKLPVAGDGAGQLKGTFDAPQKFYATNSTSTGMDLSFLSLSGLSRPNFVFKSPTSTASIPIEGGHNGTFNWNQGGVATISGGGYTTYFGYEGSLNFSSTANDKGLNSCRVYPRADSPDKRQSYAQLKNQNSISFVNACYYSKEGLTPAEYRGIYGYCLEPNPKYFPGTLADYRTLALTNPGTGGYRSFCLNWHPIDRIANQPSLAGDPAGSGQPFGDPSTAALYQCVLVGSFQDPDEQIACQNRSEYASGAAIGDASSPDVNVTSATGTDVAPTTACSERIKEVRPVRSGVVPVAFSTAAWGPKCTTDGRTCMWDLQRINPGNLIVTVDTQANDDRGKSDLDKWEDVPLNSDETGILFDDIESIEYRLTYATRDNGNGLNGDYKQTCDNTICANSLDGSGNEVGTTGDANKQIYVKSSASTHHFIYLQRDADARENEKQTIRKSWTDLLGKEYLQPAVTRLNAFDKINNIGGTDGYPVEGRYVCDHNRNFFAIKPRWEDNQEQNGKALQGWHLRMCDPDGSANAEIAFVEVTLHLAYNRTFTKWQKKRGTFCTDFVRLIGDGGRQVRWDAKLRATPLTDTIGSVPAGTGATARLTIGQEYREWENVNTSRKNSSSYIRQRSPASSESGVTNDPDGTSWRNQPGAAGGYSNSTPDTITQNAYARLYEYWQWDGSKYACLAQVDGNGNGACGSDATKKAILDSKWNDQKIAATPPTVPSMVLTAQFSVAAADAGGRVTSSELQKVDIEYTVDVTDDNQLPIRFLEVDWGDGTTIQTHPWDPAGDGRGIDDKQGPRPTSGADTRPLFPFKFTHLYDLDKLLNTDTTVCVRAIDNFQAGVKRCTNISVKPDGTFIQNPVSLSGDGKKTNVTPDTLIF